MMQGGPYVLPDHSDGRNHMLNHSYRRNHMLNRVKVLGALPVVAMGLALGTSTTTTKTTTPATTTSSSSGSRSVAPTSVSAGSGGGADRNGVPTSALLLGAVGAAALTAGGLRLRRR